MLAAHEKAQKNRGQGWTCKSIRGQGTDQMGRSSGKGPEDSSDAFSFEAEGLSVFSTGEETHLEAGLGSLQPHRLSQAPIMFSEMGSVTDLGGCQLLPVRSDLCHPRSLGPGWESRKEGIY